MLNYGLNIIRAFELSWLNAKGKPQIALLEASTHSTGMPIDSWQLKRLLGELCNSKYNNLSEVQNIVQQRFQDVNFKITEVPNFSAVKFFEHLILSDFTVISEGFRFICAHTNQPYIGTLNLVLNNNIIENVNFKDKSAQIKIILTGLRNEKFTPQNFVEQLYKQLQSIVDFELISVHLNRRGGISQQFIRSTKQLDFSLFIYPSILE